MVLPAVKKPFSSNKKISLTVLYLVLAALLCGLVLLNHSLLSHHHNEKALHDNQVISEREPLAPISQHQSAPYHHHQHQGAKNQLDPVLGQKEALMAAEVEDDDESGGEPDAGDNGSDLTEEVDRDDQENREPADADEGGLEPSSVTRQVSDVKSLIKSDPQQRRPPLSNQTIAYAISLIKCGDFQTNAAGLMDAAIILRHSIHLISSRHNNASKYDYNMVAIVHRQAVECSSLLEKVGFEIMVVDPPVQPSEIQGEYLRKNIHEEWCCGHDEFIKWYPYKMTQYPAVVHVDIDFAFLQPMDEIFDSIIYEKDSPEGQAARRAIERERPNDPLPDKIDALFTRDWPQVIPGRVSGYQAGFMVVRPDPTVFDQLTEIVRKGDYVEGHTVKSGWGGLGYCGFVGAKAMQGLIAYYYDQIRPDTWIELNQCRYNWMGMDIRYRAAPNFQRNHPKVGKCRNDLEECEDCMVTPLDKIKSVHYNFCRKPWNCVGVGAAGGEDGAAIDIHAGSYEKCMDVVRRWHELRADFESKLYDLTKDDLILKAASQNYKKEVFLGHCGGEGGKNYSQIDASDESLAKVPLLYRS
jgi:hypothetical protein